MFKIATAVVCCKRLLYVVGFHRPLATISMWTTFTKRYCSYAVQEGVQDGCRSSSLLWKNAPQSIKLRIILKIQIQEKPLQPKKKSEFCRSFTVAINNELHVNTL